ncbi:tetratricopeptide repeat protein [Mesorhizobium sp.]|uniref:tetratricopeptide repeat protein n=1 Tax=Mesorhizobium sp. TaxID=1871066 RepID=UPI000FE39233|nr:tetratricopeptide repeat protein [Mesorhizobium sp.]RWA69903.1 MAG: tetratricopeptide repeat protein [Mesorhizobium sp.]RWB97166.1 MAG: tetratricopeptide repeat protein [Mesorhizobium sp.]RWG79523.1 MAG: tetratricopeptide repeat protein [Mesorhizobium sp.]RWG79757.1 MAG: tetratricopeptide repeat protein [Mesorhizobium sp.]RWJ98520.1 MAG: tetratricopeptide repeat protein [Mesorhizobium sp.]
MEPATPAAPAVRETLERLLASETFGRSERARRLLRYLVEREQAGEGDRLKGLSIAMDVFGKDGDFDSATDAVVRVQAGRLRELLEHYFANEGIAEPVRIAIPRGGYVPSYELNAIRLPEAAKPADAGQVASPSAEHFENPAPADTKPADAAPLMTSPATPMSASSLTSQLRFFWAAIVLVIAMLGVLVVRQGNAFFHEDAAAPVETSGTTGSVVSQTFDSLPLIYMAVRADGPEAARVASSLRAGLAGFDTIDFIGRDADATRDGSADPISFVFDLVPGPAAGDVTIELQSVATGRVLLSRNLTSAESAPGAVESSVANLLTSTIPASGAIYSYIDQSDVRTSQIGCLVLNDRYYLDQSAKTHEAAYRCLEKLAGTGTKSSLVYSELASLHLEAVNNRYAYPPDATIEQAMSYAHRAIQMGPMSPHAHRAYGYLNSRLGNTDEAIRWMRKAYELNTYDLGMAAAYGYGLIFAGKYQEGTPILGHAVEAFSGHPTWWDYGLFVGAFMQGDTKRAVIASESLRTTKSKSHYLAARLIGAKISGRDQLADELANELTAEFPKFAANPRATFVDRKYPADLTDRLVQSLRSAGIGNPS